MGKMMGTKGERKIKKSIGFATLNAPFEESLATLTGPDAVVVA